MVVVVQGLGDGVGVVGVVSGHGVVGAVDGGPWIVGELDDAEAGGWFRHAVVKLAICLGLAIITNAVFSVVGRAVVVGVDDVAPWLDEVLGGDDELLPVVAALVEEWRGRLTGEVDDEEGCCEGEDGDDGDADADDDG